MDAQSAGPITIDTPHGGDVTLQSMVGIEGLSRLFLFKLDVLSARDDLDSADLLGHPVTVHLQQADENDDHVRHWNGCVTRFQYVGTGDDGASRYRLTVRPWLWYLTRSADCRIFQNLSIPDILARVFRDRHFTDFESALSETYDRREYVVQYHETDFDFVSRLMQREGIYYFFRHEEGKHTLVLADSPSAHEPVQGCEQVPYAPPDSHRDATIGYMRQWRELADVQAGKFAHSDYDFTRPRVPLYARDAAAEAEADLDLRTYDFPGRFATFSAGESIARLRLGQLRARSRAWAGESNARGLAVGATFELSNGPRQGESSEYLVVGARYRLQGHDVRSSNGARAAPFSSSLRAIEARTTFRPPIAARRPVALGPQTAVVVGPAGREIWTDQYGRVKVQFYWDREGQNDENSSCFVRVSQAWAGPGWGAQFIPRIGQEVVVDFLEGDPDRPIVTGSVYNGANPPPFTLPESQTQSGVRMRSSPGGTPVQGNEIRFDDRMGQEDLFVQAQGTQAVVVKGDQTATIGGDRRSSVAGGEVAAILGGRTTTVTVGDDTSIFGVSTLLVTGDRTVTITGDASEEVHGNRSVIVTGSRSVDVTGDVSRHVSGRVEATSQGLHNEAYGDDFLGRHAGHRVVIVGGPAASASACLHVEGPASAYAADMVDLAALRGLTLICGKSEIRVRSDAITLASPQIWLTSDDVELKVTTLNVSATGALAFGASKVSVTSTGASLALDSNATVQGGEVLLQGGGGASAQDARKNTISTVTTADQNGQPLSGERVLVRTGGEGGVERMLVLDAKGALEIRGDDPFDVAFVDCADPAGASGAAMRSCVVRPGDHLSKFAAQMGFDPDAVWAADENAELRKKRSDPHILCSGDVLYLPEPKRQWHPCNVGGATPFAMKRRMVSTSLTLSQHGKPLASARCVVHVPQPREVMTDGSGTLTFDAPASQEFVTVEFAEPRIIRRMRIGHLDPMSEKSGLLQRLTNLGHFTPTSGQGASAEDALGDALTVFQRSQKLTVTGECDEATQARLDSLHGC